MKLCCYAINDMKKIIIGVAIILGFSTSAFADGLFLETGAGVFKSLDSLAVLLRYQIKAPPLFGYPGHYEAVMVYWNGSSSNTGFGLAREIVWSEVKKNHVFSTSFGLMGVTRTTDHLGTYFQFYIRVAYNVVVWDRDVSLGLVHVSNGKSIFGWRGHNDGENFITLSVGLF
jgi:hypothetical protein